MKSLVVAGLLLALLVTPGTLGVAAAASSPCSRPTPGFAYHWPIKPFDHQHPVRGGVGHGVLGRRVHACAIEVAP